MKRTNTSNELESAKRPRPSKVSGEENLQHFAAVKSIRENVDRQEARQNHLALLEEGTLDQDHSQLFVAPSRLYTHIDDLQGDKKKAIALAQIMGLIHAAKLCRQTGCIDGANKTLKEAATLASERNESLEIYINDLYAKWNPTYINMLPDDCLALIFKHLGIKSAIVCKETCQKWNSVMLKTWKMKPNEPVIINDDRNHIDGLPSEVLFNIFQYLNASDLCKSRRASSRWRNIISSSPGLWVENVVLHGQIEAVERKWKTLRKLSGDNITRMRSLQLKLSDYYGSHIEDQMLLSTFFHQIPYDSLLEFDCEMEDTMDAAWNCVIRCSKLKVLHIGGFLSKSYETIPLFASGTPLANCRLEEFYLSCHFHHYTTLEMDEEMLKTLSKARLIRIDSKIFSGCLYGILNSSKDTLEELHLAHRPKDDCIQGRPKLVMKRLQEFEGYFDGTSFELEAPRLINVDLTVRSAVHLSLLQGCKTAVESLKYRSTEPFGDQYSEVPLQAFHCSLFLLPQCQSLCMDFDGYTHGVKAIFKAFISGQGLQNNQVGMQQLLPNLKELIIGIKVGYSPNFSKERVDDIPICDYLYGFLTERHQLNLPPLERLELKNCRKCSVQVLVLLREMVPRFTFRYKGGE